MISDAIGSEPGVFTIGGGNFNQANLTIHFVNRFKRKETLWQLEDKIRSYVRTLPNIKYADVYDYGATAVSSIVANVDTTLFGSSLKELNYAGNIVYKALEKTKGIKSVSRSWNYDSVEYDFKINKNKAALYDMSPLEVALQVSAGLQGNIASIFTVPNEQGYFIRVILSPKDRDHIQKLMSYLIKTPKGFVPLEAFGEFTERFEPTIITRQDMSYTLDIYGYRSTTAISHIMESFHKELSKEEKIHPIPKNIKLEQTGDIQMMTDSMKRMFKAIAIGLFLLYIVLVPTFNSWKSPIAIMIAIPLSAIGGVWSLLIADKHSALPAIMGMVLLAAIIVKNSTLIIDFIKTYHEDKKMPLEEAIKESIKIRTRPVLMTAFGTAVGMIPIALEWAIGLERLSPLAVVAIGGLIFGTMLSLVYVPFFYYMLSKALKKNKNI